MQFGDIRDTLNTMIKYLKSIDRNTENNTCCVADTSAGSDTSIPAGFASISIMLLSGSITVLMSDGSMYPMTITNETLVQAAPQNKTLPAVTISGSGTWKWSAIK